MNQNRKLRGACSRLDESLRADPVGRGIARLCAASPRDRAASLISAAESLAQCSTVAIATGFCIIDAPTPAAETDGPPGALFLASLLAELGREVLLVSDAFAAPALELGCDRLGLPRSIVQCVPFEDANSASGDVPTQRAWPRADAWAEDFLKRTNVTHLVAIERPGPSHTANSATRGLEAPDLAARFEREVPAEHRNVCHNMRGDSIEAFTAGVHRLFELAGGADRAMHTIGIGDGGNEIGFGAIDWPTLRRAIDTPQAGRIACRIATDDLLIGGTSDWGAYALATATAISAERPQLISPGQVQRQRELIEALVRETSLVDGVTRRREPTIDSLPLDVYLDVLARNCAIAVAASAA